MICPIMTFELAPNWSQIGCFPWADPENFNRGGPILATFWLVDEGREDPNSTIIWPSSANQQNACVGLVALWFYRGSGPVLLRNLIFLWFFRKGGGYGSPVATYWSFACFQHCLTHFETSRFREFMSPATRLSLANEIDAIHWRRTNIRRVLHQSSSISALPEHLFLGMSQWRSW